MKNVLVTGAAGFIGSHLVMHHAALGDRVVGFDSYISSNKKSPHSNELEKLSNVAIFECDICDYKTMEQCSDYVLSKGYTFDVIYNFACPASPPQYQAASLYTIDTCVTGMKNVCELARDHGAVVVQASTSEVYGDPDVHPQQESYRGCVNPYGPRACYDEGKRLAESICYEYTDKCGVDARLVRIFNTYGPHMHPTDGRVVTNFIWQAINGLPLTVYGNGQQTRSLCYVSDLVAGIVKLGSLPFNPSGPINLGNPAEVTVLQIAETINKLAGSTSEVVFEELPIDDPRKRCPDISSAKRLLDWEPTIELEDGLTRTIAWVREHYT